MTLGIIAVIRSIDGDQHAGYYLEGCRRLIEACSLDCREEYNAAVEALG